MVGGGVGAAGVVIFDLTDGPRFPFLLFGGGGGVALAVDVGGGPASTIGMAALVATSASSSSITSSSVSSTNTGVRVLTPQSRTHGS